jgi:multidrug efflux pump subunit AcrA (membrane-fusion protein)
MSKALFLHQPPIISMNRQLLKWSLLILLTGCQRQQGVIHPEVRAITQSVYASAVVKSRNQYQVFAKVPGVIDRLYVSEGDTIRRGQVLMEIANPASRLSVDQSRLAARYNDVSNNTDKLQELRYNADVARQRYQNDSLLNARQQALWAQNIGSRVELEQRDLNARNSKASYQSALLRYQELRKQLSFQEQQARLALDISASQAADLQVRSETDGQVFSILKKQGEMVTAQTPIAIVGNSRDYYLELQVDEYDIAQLQEGQQVLLTMDSYKDQVFEARVSRIYPIMNERSRTFTVEARFVKAPARLFPNLTAEANVVIRTKQRALLIPRACLTEDGAVILRDGRRQPVQTGLKDYQQVEILSGLKPEDQIQQPQP